MTICPRRPSVAAVARALCPRRAATGSGQSAGRPSVAAVLGTLCLLLAAAPADAQNAFFDEGNRLYQAGDFDGALDRYRRILDAGLESGDLHYNIGNTYFRLGALGPAILHYERARRLMPGDDDLLANLALARSLTADEIVPRPRFWLFRLVDWWVGLLPRAGLLWLVALAWVTAVAGAALVVLRPAARAGAWARRTAFAAAAVTVVFGVNLVVRELDLGAAAEAIVMADEAQVQSAPSDDPALRIFAVHEGAKVRMDRRSGDWVEIVLEDGSVGWMRTRHLEPIRTPVP